MKILVFLLGLMVLAGGCMQGPGQVIMGEDDHTHEEGMGEHTHDEENSAEGDVLTQEKVVETGSQVKVEYRGTFPDTGEVFDQSTGRGPLEFTAGAGQMIKGFDAAVIGMKLNEEKTVVIPPEDAYGVAGSGPVLTANVDQLPPDSKAGDSFTSGNGQQVTIVTIDGNSATVRVVHALAGKTLQFWIKVVDIQ